MIWWAAIFVTALTAIIAVVGTMRHPDFWISNDLRAQHLQRAGKPAEAAKAYDDPMRQGAAFYRHGDFEAAAQAFARCGGAVGAYDQGTALLMHGAYDASIDAYTRALSLRPGWQEAIDNRAIAVARKARIESQRNPDESTGQEKPDEIAVDLHKPPPGADKPVVINSGDALSDEALRAQWLRRVQTRPADFLKARFSFESQSQVNGGAK